MERFDWEDINLVTPTRLQPNPHSRCWATATMDGPHWQDIKQRCTTCARNASRCRLIPFSPSFFPWLSSLTVWPTDACQLLHVELKGHHWLHTDKCDLLWGAVWKSGFLRGWTQLLFTVQKPQLVPCRILRCFITVEHKVVLCFRVFYSSWHSETTIYDINLQTIRKINCFHF